MGLRSAVGARSGSEAPKVSADCEASLNNVNGDKENDPSERSRRSALPVTTLRIKKALLLINKEQGATNKHKQTKTKQNNN